jgi:hypothetical protein
MFKTLLYDLLVAVFLLAPAAVTSLLLAAYFNASLLDCSPQFGVMGRSDEMHYWSEIDSFKHVGFNSGYFVVDERPAPARWSHFGPHGPGFPMVYGGLGCVFGWYPESGPLFNLGWILAGSIAWLILVRPTLKQLAAAVLVVMTVWPVLFYIPATLQESFHCAIAFVLAGLAHRRINGRDSRLWPFIVVVAAVSLLRVTWALLLIAWVLVAMNGASKRSRILTLAIVPLLVLISQFMASPYPNSLQAFFSIVREHPYAAWHQYALHVGRNISEMVSTFLWPMSAFWKPLLWSPYDRILGQPLHMAQRYQILALMLIGASIALRLRPSTYQIGVAIIITAVLMLIVKMGMDVIVGPLFAAWSCRVVWKKSERRYLPVVASVGVVALMMLIHADLVLRMYLGSVRVYWTYVILLMSLCLIHRDVTAGLARRFIGAPVPGPADPQPYLFSALNMALIAAIVVGLYDVKYDRDLRVFAPHLLLSVLVLISGSAYRLGIATASVGLLSLPIIGMAFEDQHHKRFTAVGEIDLCPYLTYDGTKSAWDNTVLVADLTLEPIVRVPPGFGVTTVVENEDTWLDQRERRRVLSAPKSRYLLMAADEAAGCKNCHLKLLYETQHANLYLNQDAPVNEPVARH